MSRVLMIKKRINGVWDYQLPEPMLEPLDATKEHNPFAVFDQAIRTSEALIQKIEVFLNKLAGKAPKVSG